MNTQLIEQVGIINGFGSSTEIKILKDEGGYFMGIQTFNDGEKTKEYIESLRKLNGEVVKKWK